MLLYFQGENGQFEERKTANVRGLLHEGGMVFKHKERCGLCPAPCCVFPSLAEVHCVLFTFLKDALFLFFQACSTAGNHENIQDFLQIQSRKICFWRIGVFFH